MSSQLRHMPEWVHSFVNSARVGVALAPVALIQHLCDQSPKVSLYCICAPRDGVQDALHVLANRSAEPGRDIMSAYDSARKRTIWFRPER